MNVEMWSKVALVGAVMLGTSYFLVPETLSTVLTALPIAVVLLFVGGVFGKAAGR